MPYLFLPIFLNKDCTLKDLEVSYPQTQRSCLCQVNCFNCNHGFGSIRSGSQACYLEGSQLHHCLLHVGPPAMCRGRVYSYTTILLLFLPSPTGQRGQSHAVHQGAHWARLRVRGGIHYTSAVLCPMRRPIQ